MMRHNRAMTTFNRFIKYLTFIGILVFSSHSLAADNESETWYQIEVLVYEPVDKPIAGEIWPQINYETLPTSTIELSPVSENNNIAFQKLKPETLQLTETANKLAASRRYRIITLQAWQQPIKQRHEAESVRLTDKQISASDSVLVENGETILNPPLQGDFELNETVSEEIPARIDGTVTVSLARYLHMALKLRYYNPDVYLAEQIALQKPDEVLINTFMMNQSRRMRSKEIHVFDHPYFGVIATITPVERESGKEEAL